MDAPGNKFLFVAALVFFFFGFLTDIAGGYTALEGIGAWLDSLIFKK